MSEIWKPADPTILRHWVDTILDEASDDLTSWESTFVASVDEQLTNGRVLSRRQEEILEGIYSEKTP